MTSQPATEDKGSLKGPSGSVDATVLRRILEAIGKPPRTIYYPAEDSLLMLDAISDVPLEGKQVLDLGTGSGIFGIFCAVRRATVTIADIDEDALRHAVRAAESLELKVRPIMSDLFSNVRERFDVILFNPPYLPSTKIHDETVDGGARGLSLIRRFIRQLPNYLRERGAAFLLLSSLNEPETVVAEHPRFHFSIVARQALFFEELQVLRLLIQRDSAPQGSDG